MADFFQQYFIDPIVTQGVAGYNIYNTPVYAVCFALAVWLAYKLLKKLQISIDRAFFIGILPYILLGSVLRVVRDSNITTSWILVSPIIYFAIFIIAIAGLLISVGIERIWLRSISRRGEKASAEVVRKEISRKGEMAILSKAEAYSYSDISPRPRLYHKIWFVLGLIPLGIGLTLLFPLGIQSWFALGAIIGITAAWAAVIFFAYKSKIAKWFSLENAGILLSQMFDAATTFTALQFFPNYYEQHVVSGFVIGALGPWGQFLLKLAIVPAVLWALDRELPKPEDRQVRGFIKIAILILGLAPGLRNGLRLVLGV